jgi:integrase
MAQIITIGKGKDKHYKAIVEMGKDPSTGHRKRRTKIFSKKGDAESWMGDMISSRDNGTAVDPSKLTVGEFLDKWLENHKKPNIEQTTYDGYKIHVDAHLKPLLGYIPLQSLEPYHIETYFAQKRKSGRRDDKEGGLSENTLNKHYITLNNALNRAVKLKLIKYNPMQAIDPPKPEKKEAPVMSKLEYEKLLNVLKNDLLMFTFVFTELMTGMRKSEILGLEWPDVDLKKGIINVRQALVRVNRGLLHKPKLKNDSSRRKIKISDTLISILNKYKIEQAKIKLQLGIKKKEKDKEFVFCKLDGTYYRPKYYNDKLNEYLDKARLSQKYTIHTLRHTFATINVNNKIDSEIVQKMLGHSTISTTIDLYYHHDVEQQKEAVDKLDQTININI